MHGYYRNNYTRDVKLKTKAGDGKQDWNSFSRALENQKGKCSSDRVIGDINPEMDRIMGRN